MIASRKRVALLLSLLVLVTLSPAMAATKRTHSKHAATKGHHASSHARKKARKASPRGQQAIDSERATEIQQALIREHYLSGEPTGSWDVATERAMQHYQQDQGFQAKSVPDSRALIRLGLGPSHQHLLNPESAMTTGPEPSPADRGSQPATAAGSLDHSPGLTGASSVASPAALDGGSLAPVH